MEFDLRKALYETKCISCGSQIYWEANFDADNGTSWFGNCCYKHYNLTTSKVNLWIEDE